MDAAGERARLVGKLIQAATAIGSTNLATPQHVDALLKDLRRHVPHFSDASDETLLRTVLVELTGDYDAALSPEERKMLDMLQRGKELYYKKHFDEAAKVLRVAEQLATQNASEHGLAWAKQYLGRIARDLGRFDKAMLLYEESLAIAGRISHTDLVAVIYDQIGTTFRLRGDFDQAQTYYQMALAVDPESESFVKGNLSILYQARGDASRAMRLNEESKNAYQIEGNRRGEAMTSLVKAQDLLSRNDYAGAGASALEAHRLGAETEYAVAIEQANKMFVRICSALLLSADGIPNFRKVLALDWRQSERDIQKDLLTNAFMSALDRNLPSDAADFAWALSRLATKHHEPEKLAWMWKHGWMRPSPLQKVETHLSKILRAQSAGGNPKVIATTKLSLAQCRAAWMDYKSALQIAAEAKALLARNASPEDEKKLENFCEEVRTVAATAAEAQS